MPDHEVGMGIAGVGEAALATQMLDSQQFRRPFEVGVCIAADGIDKAAELVGDSPDEPLVARRNED